VWTEILRILLGNNAEYKVQVPKLPPDGLRLRDLTEFLTSISWIRFATCVSRELRTALPIPKVEVQPELLVIEESRWEVARVGTTCGNFGG
jgi:hypothetical protein